MAGIQVKVVLQPSFELTKVILQYLCLCFDMLLILGDVAGGVVEA